MFHPLSYFSNHTLTLSSSELHPNGHPLPFSHPDHTRLSVWVLDGEPVHGELLEFAMSPNNLEHTLVLLTVSMTTPWAIMDQLHTWASTLQDHIDKLNLDPDYFKERQDKSE